MNLKRARESVVMLGTRISSLLLVAIAAVTVPSALGASSSKSQPITSFAPRSIATRSTVLKNEPVMRKVAALDSVDLSRRGGAVVAPNQVVSALGLFAINYGVSKAFAAYDVRFPAMLGGCIILFVALLLADVVKSGLGTDIFDLLMPGGNLLAKWLPVFFVPGLAMVPKAPSLGTPLDVRQVFLHPLHFEKNAHIYGTLSF